MSVLILNGLAESVGCGGTGIAKQPRYIWKVVYQERQRKFGDWDRESQHRCRCERQVDELRAPLN